MQHILRPLTARPWKAVELLAASLLIAVLNLASPLFVIQLLNRYVSFGFEGTLITLVAGMLIAILLLFGFKVARSVLVRDVFARSESATSHSLMMRVLYTDYADETWREGRTAYDHFTAVQAAHNVDTVEGVLDAPFSLLYLLAVFLLSTGLGCVLLGGLVLTYLAHHLSFRHQASQARRVSEAESVERVHAMAGMRAPETVRVFQGRAFLLGKWERALDAKAELKRSGALTGALGKHGAGIAMLLTTTVLYTLGALEVVGGTLTTGALIGASILSSRAAQTVIRFVQARSVLAKADAAQAELERGLSGVVALDQGMTPEAPLSGPVALEHVSFRYEGAEQDLISDLNLVLEPGRLTVFTGVDGSGKTSLARILAGLLPPSQGSILASEVNLKQYSASWWRKQLIYLPEDPQFLPGSLLENLLMGNPSMSEQDVATLVNETGLAQYLYTSPMGYHLPVLDNGMNLPFGVRKRLSMARALSTNGRFLILDEPTEGLDARGRAMIYALIQRACAGKRIVAAMSNDPVLVKGAWQVVELANGKAPQVSRPGEDRAGEGEISGARQGDAT